MKRSALFLGFSIWALVAAQEHSAVVHADFAHAAQTGRVRIVAQTTDARLEDVQQSKDGTRLVTHDRGFAPRLWDVKTMRLLRVLSGQAESVDTVLFSPDGAKILCVAGKEMALWEAKRGKELHRFAPPDGDEFTSAAYSPDSKLVALGTKLGLVILLDAGDPRQSRAHRGHTDEKIKPLNPYVRDLEFSEDGNRLISGSVDKTARVWDVQSGKQISVFEGPEHIVQWVHLSANGKIAVATSLDNVAHVFDAETGKLLWRKPHFIGPKGLSTPTHMGALFVGKERNLVATASEDGTITLNGAVTGAAVRELKGHTKRIREIRRSQDGTKIATYGDDDQLKIWNTETAKEYPFPHRSYQETAGEFSPDGKTWWLGHQDGKITAHDVESGAVRSEALGAVQNVEAAYQPLLDIGPYTSLGTYQVLWNSQNPRERRSGYISARAPEFSPDGESMLMWRNGEEYPLLLLDVRTRKSQMAFKNQLGARFSPDSSKFVTWTETGLGTVWNAETGQEIKGWKWDEKLKFSSCAFLSNGTHVASVGADDGGFIFFWEVESGKGSPIYKLKTGDPLDVAITPDGSKAIVAGLKGVEAINTTTGASEAFVESEIQSTDQPRLWLSPDGEKVLVLMRFRAEVYEVKSGKRLLNRRHFGGLKIPYGQFSSDSRRILIHEENQVNVWDLESGRPVLGMLLADRVQTAAFTPDNKRILTADNTDGMTIWDISSGKAVRVGNFIVMINGDWLAYDMEGRFDAADPDRTEGAHFVMEWEGGLEPVALTQLKAQFYEPGLLAKMLGQDPEPPRGVPNLDDLRLFPEVKVTPRANDPMSLDIELGERDEGGIGRVTVSINGKQVNSRRGVGFFRFDVKDYQQFLLPQTHLPRNQGNLVQVTAANEAGTLVSLPATIDIGAPASLRIPEVHIHALCVGVGDYVGSQADLAAPASDAKAMGKALSEVGDKLLPGRVSVTVYTTDAGSPDEEPTRARILQWFEQTATRSTSSDVLLVFFAGHGVSRIGEQSGYFFLTPEANPTEVNSLSASTQTISGEDLKSMLGKIAASKQVVILDTCHSGAAAKSLMESDRSISGDYQRAWESIRDATGVWMLAGSAADQKSYESANVEHGMLTYALLEAIDKASSEGLRPGTSGDLFVDVERWLNYAAGRVESLKNEVGLAGIQRPEFRRAKSGRSFDIGVVPADKRGMVGLKAPKPVVIMGNFSMQEEDPAGLEEPIRKALRLADKIKAWFDVAKHPNVYRVAGTYESSGNALSVKVFLQQFDTKQIRKTMETFEVKGSKTDIGALAESIRKELEARIEALEKARATAATPK